MFQGPYGTETHFGQYTDLGDFFSLNSHHINVNIMILVYSSNIFQTFPVLLTQLFKKKKTVTFFRLNRC